MDAESFPQGNPSDVIIRLLLSRRSEKGVAGYSSTEDIAALHNAAQSSCAMRSTVGLLTSFHTPLNLGSSTTRGSSTAAVSTSAPLALCPVSLLEPPSMSLWPEKDMSVRLLRPLSAPPSPSPRSSEGEHTARAMLPSKCVRWVLTRCPSESRRCCRRCCHVLTTTLPQGCTAALRLNMAVLPRCCTVFSAPHFGPCCSSTASNSQQSRGPDEHECHSATTLLRRWNQSGRLIAQGGRHDPQCCEGGTMEVEPGVG